MSKVGIEPVPPGETANFDGLSELQVGILAVYVVTSVLATIGLVLRFYTGAFIVRSLGIDACTLCLSFDKLLWIWETGRRGRITCITIHTGFTESKVNGKYGVETENSLVSKYFPSSRVGN